MFLEFGILIDTQKNREHKSKYIFRTYLFFVILVATSASIGWGFVSLSRFLAINAHYIATLSTRPVKIEQSHFTYVAHFTHSLDDSFPGYLLLNCVTILCLGCQRFGLCFFFCLNHPAKLVADVSKKKQRHVNIQLLNRFFRLG